MQSTESFANKLKELRSAKGLSQRQLANLLFVSNGTVANWETGNRLPDINMITRISNCLGVEPYTLISELDQNVVTPPIIAVVEDVPVILRGNIHMLEQEIPRAEIVGFSTASEALSYADSNPISIAFLDIELPGENGLVLGRKLKAINPRLNLIYLTSHLEYMEDAINDHCSGYILKPLSPDRIRHEISDLRYPVRGLGL